MVGLVRYPPMATIGDTQYRTPPLSLAALIWCVGSLFIHL